ncbi:MAG: hypothetical protein ACKODA_11910 [Nevskiaceae bacterium]
MPTPARAPILRSDMRPFAAEESKMRKSPSILALTVVALAAPSLAQQSDPNPSPEAKLEEIVVTARLRSERLQDIPASIAAFDETAIERSQLNTLDKLSFQVPSLAASDPFG